MNYTTHHSNTSEEAVGIAQAFRQQFPALRDSGTVHLDNAATTHKPQVVLSALQRVYTTQNANVHRASHNMANVMTNEFEQARQTVHHFLNASDLHECVWTSGTTEGINLLAHSWGRSHLGSDDNIVLSVMEHHANIVPWQLLQKSIGFEIRVIPLNDEQRLDMSALDTLIDARTRLVGVCHASNVLGVVNPVEAIIAKAKQVNAVTLIDGAQAVAHLDVDVQALDCDAYVFSGHKLFAPTGIGVLCAKKDLLNDCTPYQGGGEMIEEVSFEYTTYQNAPLKFEAGTPAFAQAAALGVSIEWLQSLNKTALKTHQQSLYRFALASLKAWSVRQNVDLVFYGSPTATQSNVGIIAFSLTGHHPKDIAEHMNQYGIALRAGHHCAMPLLNAMNQPDGVVRIALAAYNSDDDVHKLLAALDEWCELHPPTVEMLETEAVDDSERTVELDESGDIVEQSLSLYEQLINEDSSDKRYKMLLQAGKPYLLNEKQRASIRKKKFRIKGCESQVWLSVKLGKQPPSQFEWMAESEAKIIRGLLCLVQEICPDNACAVADFDFLGELEKLGLSQYLGLSRTNGLRAIIHALQSQAREVCDALEQSMN